eukprot:CAMPEP_0202870800 /NCGR_PEP_ID=MMETSP1391-20130828/16797_1 /ASSEMBLY_ACC=CAM_ASM_000867 /TAXON_ID=1034604 /ORGANISM="Chlamydomonas leiostraca, Strain SAG 11-49" /LENGTH=33 /DNA_ID= /DNA_START= /DNA_END= /DNA_ORIENTATION=
MMGWSGGDAEEEAVGKLEEGAEDGAAAAAAAAA